MRDSATRRIILLSVALFAVRCPSLLVVAQPGYTDAYYYATVAERLAHGDGLTADFVWNFLEAPNSAPLPIASHRFWMPLTSVIAAGGIALVGAILGAFRAGQLPILLLASLVPWLTWRLARAQGASANAALVAGALAGMGGMFAPAWVALDGFAPAAVLGSLFFLAYAPAARGVVRSGLLAGIACGLLYLVRAEAALFGLGLLALVVRVPSRRPGLVASGAALAIGVAWFVRGMSVGGAGDALARSAFIVRYEDFFAVRPIDAGLLAESPLDALTLRLSALGSDAVTAGAALMVLLVVPLAFGVFSLRRRPEVFAFAGLALVIYLAEGILWPLHATRGSYFHSLAAFFPFAVALACVGGERWLNPRGERAVRVAMAATLIGAAVLSLTALQAWDTAFNAPFRQRASAVELIPAGPLLAIDAAAWRWVASRPALVTPADGLAAAACVVQAYDARSLVLEEAHFRAYDDLYSGGERPSWLGAPRDRGTIRVFPVVATPPCLR